MDKRPKLIGQFKSLGSKQGLKQLNGVLAGVCGDVPSPLVLLKGAQPFKRKRSVYRAIEGRSLKVMSAIGIILRRHKRK